MEWAASTSAPGAWLNVGGRVERPGTLGAEQEVIVARVVGHEQKEKPRREGENFPARRQLPTHADDTFRHQKSHRHELQPTVTFHRLPPTLGRNRPVAQCPHDVKNTIHFVF